VRWNGRAFEALVARREHRRPAELFHSALEVRIGTQPFVVEMAPAWVCPTVDRGVVGVGPVGSPGLGRLRAFRYELRRWRDGVIPDVREAVGGAREVGAAHAPAQRLLDLVPQVPTATWGLDEQQTGEIWNSNSVTAWLLSCSGHDASGMEPPRAGRAAGRTRPGWQAGLVVAARTEALPLRGATGPPARTARAPT
jgi:hypothetical protein